MVFGKLFKSLSGTSSTAPKESTSEPLQYNGFTIEAAPLQDNGQFRTAGYISGECNGETKRIQFIRADQNVNEQAAIDHSIKKAKQIIDEQGIGLLERPLL